MLQLTILKKRMLVLATVTFAITLVVLTYGTLKGDAIQKAEPTEAEDIAVGSNKTRISRWKSNSSHYALKDSSLHESLDQGVRLC